MMGKQSEQLQMVILDIDSMIPKDHLLRQIKNCVNFDFIHDEYYGAAEPPVRCGVSHLSGLTEPPIDSYSA